MEARFLEGVGLAGFWLLFGMMCSYLPDPTTAFFYLVISHAVAGIIHVQITLRWVLFLWLLYFLLLFPDGASPCSQPFWRSCIPWQAIQRWAVFFPHAIGDNN
jgi:hypothetical protein